MYICNRIYFQEPACSSQHVTGYTGDNMFLGTSFEKARWAFWVKDRKGFGLYWCVYTIGHRCPLGLRDARKGIGVRQVLVLDTTF